MPLGHSAAADDCYIDIFLHNAFYPRFIFFLDFTVSIALYLCCHNTYLFYKIFILFGCVHYEQTYNGCNHLLQRI